MARYNREFLVPYLQDVCALHLALNKVQDCLVSSQGYKHRLQEGLYHAVKPSEPKVCVSTEFAFGGFFGIGGLIGCLLFLCLDYDWFSNLLVFIFLGIPSTLGVIGFLIYYIREHIEIISEKKRYEKELQEYNRIQKINREKKSTEIPEIDADIQQCNREIRRIQATLQTIYQVNIIPSRYRTVYAAVYLFDWFSTSRADDLDMALNMFVLEEIKDRLDTIIRNQSTMILNQRMMLANQQHSYEAQQRHNAMMRSKVDRLAASSEERNIYLSMIESNTAATAYFAAADFIKKL